MKIIEGKRSRERRIIEETAEALFLDFPHLFKEQELIVATTRATLKNSRTGMSDGKQFALTFVLIPEVELFLKKHLGNNWFMNSDNVAFFLKVWPLNRIKSRR